MLPHLFLFISLLLSSSFFSHSHSQCLHHQKTLLLQLKNELIFNSSISTKLVQWNQRDDECCKWYGVECDSSGNVVSLQLDHESISDGFGDSSSLFKLEHLQKLNMAYNDFNGPPIPKGIQNLTYLTHLNLSDAAFVGQIPAEMLSLKRLVSLDVSHMRMYKDVVSLMHPNLEMLVQNLTELRELYLDSVFISYDEKRKWSHIISSYLPNITTLSLIHCYVSGPLAKSFWKLHSISILRLDNSDLSETPLDLFAKISSLTTLSLSNCGLNDSLPNTLFQMPVLHNLDLSFNRQLSGSIPPFTQTGSLKSLVLKDTNLSGLIPSSISNLKELSHIDLYYCKFIGSLPSTFANLTQLTHVDLSSNFFTGSLSPTLFEGLSNLVYLNLMGNSFTGNIPPSLLGLPLLVDVQLSSNNFTGQVDEFPIVNVSNIVALDLRNNSLGGPIPHSLFQLHSLEYLMLSQNLFNGTFRIDKIQRLSNLTYLDLSGNNLSIDVSKENLSTYELPKLRVLMLHSCNMSSFPDFIKNSHELRQLDLSNNQIAGEIPSWIWGKHLWYLDLSFNLLTYSQKPYNISASLSRLDLGSNQLKGELRLLIQPNITYDLWHLLLANNSFSGSIPTSLCSAANLYSLDLSVNEFSGSIPSCLLENISVLHLGGNNISGRIPDNFTLDCNLNYFDLSSNSLEGKIPKSLESCISLEFMNVGNNMINDTFPCMLSDTLRVLVLHSNRFHGEVICDNSWPNLQILDISLNHFGGSLELMNFSRWRKMVLESDPKLRQGVRGYYSLPFLSSGVTLIMKGLKVELYKIWSEFSTLDFSSNNFQGRIPNAIGNLSSLHHLNFSLNALNESIPKSMGQLGELESLDLSGNQLTGSIPVELAGLTFLSFLNVSYNKLVGVIPNGRQFQTFSADSFEGNSGLCGFPLNTRCSHTTDDDISPPKHEDVEEKREIEWEYVSAALGYVVGLASIVWLLLFCRSFREKYFGKIEEVVEDIFIARDMRRRRARTAVRNRVRRQYVE